MVKSKVSMTFIFILIILVIFAFSGRFIMKKFTEQQVKDSIAESKTQGDVIIAEIPTVTGGDISLAPVEPKPDASTPNIVCTPLQGTFTKLWVRAYNSVTADLIHGYKNKPEVVGEFWYTGNCPGKIYIEAGIPNAPSPLPTLNFAPAIRGNVQAVGSASICDGNKHYNGVVVDLQPQQKVVFLLKPENYGVEAKYPLIVGAYTGCTKDGGRIIEDVPNTVYFSDKLSQFQIDGSWYGFE